MRKKNKKHKYYSIVVLFCGIVIVLIAIAIAASFGSADLSIKNSLKLMLDKVPIIRNLIDTSDVKDIYHTILWNIRMPRIFLSILTGGGLALVGSAYQGVFRNPLADPHILGVSSGAALGATIGLLTGISVRWYGLGTTGIFAFIGAIVTVFFVYYIAKGGRANSVTNMLLTGTAISTMLSAMISLLMTFHREQLEKVYMWTLGSFSAATWTKVMFLACIVVVCGSILYYFNRDLNLMLTGEEEASCLGVEIERVQKIVIVFSSILVAGCVSVSGIIGFVGLIIPHCVRLIRGSDYKRLIPYSFYFGGIFLLICDTIARTIAAPTELPVGVITSIIGAPYFIVLLYLHKKNNSWN